MLSRLRSATQRRGVRLLTDAVAPYRQMINAEPAQREAWAARDELLHAKMR